MNTPVRHAVSECLRDNPSGFLHALALLIIVFGMDVSLGWCVND